MKKLLPCLIIFFIVFFLPASAHAATLYLSPASGSIGEGNAKVVQVRLNTGGEPINGVSAYLSYPADKLSAAVGGGGPFSVVAESGAGGGAIRISKASYNGVTGDVLVATITFKGLRQGAAAVSFIGGSAAARAADSSNALTGSSGGSYTVGPYVPEPTVVPPILSDLTIEEIGTNSAVIKWKTNIKTDSAIEYGLQTGKYILSQTDTKLVTDHEITLRGEILTPGLLLYVRAVSTDGGKAIVRSEEKTIQLKGYQIKIVLTDDQNRPLSNATVQLYNASQTETTNGQGEVTFDNASPGKQLLIIKTNQGEKTQEITVEEKDAPQVIPVKLTLGQQTQQLPQPSSFSPLTWLILSVPVVLIIVTIIFLFRRKKNESTITPLTP